MGAAWGDVKQLLSLHGTRRPTFGTCWGVGLLVADAPERDDDGALRGVRASRRTAPDSSAPPSPFAIAPLLVSWVQVYQRPAARRKATIVYRPIDRLRRAGRGWPIRNTGEASGRSSAGVRRSSYERYRAGPKFCVRA
jgi:hypothetical protein